jgi:hypothetical protein
MGNKKAPTSLKGLKKGTPEWGDAVPSGVFIINIRYEILLYFQTTYHQHHLVFVYNINSQKLPKPRRGT